MRSEPVGSNEWDDPYQIVEPEAETGVLDEQRSAIIEAIIAGYGDQHTTSWLDGNASFRLEELTPIDDDPVTECEFEVQRFVHGTPARRHTGYAQFNNDGWEVTYETQPWGRELFNRVRNVLPHTSPD